MGNSQELDPSTDQASQTLLDNQTRLRPAADELEASASTDPAFSGVAVDPESNRLVVYRVGGAVGANAAGPQTFHATRAEVAVLPALWSAAEARGFEDRLEADRSVLEQEGVEVTSHGPDGEGGPYHIGVAGDVERARAALGKRYPQELSRLEVEAAAPVVNNRDSDAPPYWGGASLSFPDGSGGFNSASAGFAVRNKYGDFLITARHAQCSSSTAVYNGLSTKRIGTILQVSDPGYDAIYAKVSRNASWIYTGTLSKPNGGMNVVSVDHPRVGERICTSGSWSGLRCNGRVGGTRQITMQTCHGKVTLREWYADQVHQYSLVGQGDSGGPVFVSSFGAHARGIISGGDDGRPANCAEGHNNRKCSYRAYFTDVKVLATRHGFDFVGF